MFRFIVYKMQLSKESIKEVYDHKLNRVCYPNRPSTVPTLVGATMCDAWGLPVCLFW